MFLKLKKNQINNILRMLSIAPQISSYRSFQFISNISLLLLAPNKLLKSSSCFISACEDVEILQSTNFHKFPYKIFENKFLFIYLISN